jgi:PAS domain S-box-containing protein
LEASLGSPDGGNHVGDSRQDRADRRREDAEALRESEEKFRLAFSNANTGMCLVDLQGRLLQVNDKMTEIFGYSRRELESMTVDDLALPEDAGLSREFIDQAVQQRKHSDTFEKRYRHRQGHVIYGQVASSLVRDAQGRPRYFISQVQDITRRKQAEQELSRLNAELEQRVRERTAELTQASRELQRALAILETLLIQAPIGFAYFDRELRFLLINDLLAEINGAPAAAHLGKRLQDMVPNLAPLALKVINQILATGQGVKDREFYGEPPSTPGVMRYFNEDWYPVRDNTGEIIGFGVIVQEITERKRADFDLRRAKDAAEAASRAKSQFLANISHEIRTPMTAILGFSELLLRPDLSEDQRRHHVEVLQRNGQTLLRLLNDLLDLSKIEVGRLAVERLACAPWQLVDEALDLLRTRAEEKRLSLEVEYRWPLPTTFRTDPVRLRQILVNLVGNAIKFTAAGGVRIELFHTPGPPAQLCFAVADTGIGIEPAVLEHLFEPFVQADTSDTRRFGGSGLGLAICHRLAPLLGGRISVMSRPGQGSTFTLALELDPADLTTLAEADPRAVPPRLLGPAAQDAACQGRVLVAPRTASAKPAGLQPMRATTLHNLMAELQRARQNDDRERLAACLRSLSAAARVFGIADLEQSAAEVTQRLRGNAGAADLAQSLQTLLDVLSASVVA